MSDTDNQTTKNRVFKYLSERLEPSDFAHLDAMIQNKPTTGTASDRGWSVGRGMAFDQRYPGAARIKVTR
jgi:hypothetical protein